MLEEQESDLVLSALQFDETTVNDILIPRVKIVGVSSEATTDEICEMFLHSHFSRFPVYEKSMDNILQDFRNRMEHTMLQPEKVPTCNHANDVIHALFIDWESVKCSCTAIFPDSQSMKRAWITSLA